MKSFSRRDFFRNILIALIGVKYADKIIPLVVKQIPKYSPWDKATIAMVRKSMPNLIAYDICGVQPMCAPSGLVFAMRDRYKRRTIYDKPEPLFQVYSSQPVSWLEDYQRMSNQIG